MFKTVARFFQNHGRASPTFTEIHREIYWLGSRHNGEILKGARLELKGLEAGSRRAELLRAVVLKEESGLPAAAS